MTLSVPVTARLRLGWLAVSDFTGQAVTALLMIALVIGGASLLPFYGVAVVTAAVTLTLMVALVRSEVSLRPSFSLRRWRALFSESFVYTAATTLGVIYFQIVIIAMSLISTKHQTGYFGLSFRALSIVNGVPWLLVASAFPILARAARDDQDRLRYALQRLFDGALVAGRLLLAVRDHRRAVRGRIHRRAEIQAVRRGASDPRRRGSSGPSWWRRGRSAC